MVKTKIKKIEYCMVCVDESNEFIDALDYACNYANINKMGIILFYVIELENFRHWQGVENIMQKEQENKARAILTRFRKSINEKYKLKTKNIIKRGEKVEKLIDVLNDKSLKLSMLVLGLSLHEQDSNKIIGSLITSSRRKLSLPITIVPGKIK